MVRRTDAERLAAIQEEIERKEQEFKQKQAQLDARKKLLEGRLKEKEHRERTHQLILVAGVFEHHWGYLDEATADYLARQLQGEVEKLLSLRENGQN